MQHIGGYQPEVSSQLRASFLLWLAFTLKLFMHVLVYGEIISLLASALHRTLLHARQPVLDVLC